MLGEQLSTPPDAEAGYHVLNKIGQGGMAEIFLARHRSPEGLERRVVIKRILPEYSVDPDFLNAFLNEARLSSLLDHKNIVQIFDLGVEEGCYFIAMEYVEGFDLSSLVVYHKRKQQFMPVGVALSIIRDVCLGLDHAHHACDPEGNPLRIVHRDVTPSNVLIAMDGQAKVLDFGIAKAASAADNKTKTGFLKGKIGYVSPEQVLGEPFDSRADIFSTGVTLFEMLTNKNPFKGESEFNTMKMIATVQRPTLQELRADLPPGLETVMSHALTRQASDRFSSCLEFWQALEAEAQRAGIGVDTQEVANYLQSIHGEIEEMTRAARPPGSSTDSNLSGRILRLGGSTGTAALLAAGSNLALPTLEPVKSPWRWVAPAIAAVALLALAVVALTSRSRMSAVQAVVGEEPVVDVVSTPAGADVLLDGVLLTGATPLQLRGLEAGRHYQVEVRRDGFSAAKSEVDAPATGTSRMQLSLAPMPAAHAPVVAEKKHGRAAALPVAAAGSGKLRIIITPWATVRIDGKSVGETPLPALTLSAGPHTIEMDNSETGKHVTKSVTVTANQDTVFRQDLSGR